jgi:hypothetical protein
VLRPQDVLVTLTLAAHPERKWTYDMLAQALGMSLSGVHSAVSRASASGLVNPRTRRAVVPALLEFLIHGVRYVFPAERGRRTRGMLTGPSAGPLSERLAASEEAPLVWPHPRGKDRGESLKPLYDTVPEAAAKDPELYTLLTVVDGIRVGGARVREVAALVLKELVPG